MIVALSGTPKKTPKKTTGSFTAADDIPLHRRAAGAAGRGSSAGPGGPRRGLPCVAGGRMTRDRRDKPRRIQAARTGIPLPSQELPFGSQLPRRPVEWRVTGSAAARSTRLARPSGGSAGGNRLDRRLAADFFRGDP